MFRKILFAFGAVFAGAGVAALRAADRPPNIVMILADDMGWADLGADGSRIDTPNLDRLAKEGAKLTRFYASAPMCSPTRAALLTGRYPHSVGMPELASKEARGSVPVLALAHDAVTIPEALRPARYRSIVVGKWHLGFEPKDFPQHHGFDEFWGSLLGTPGFWQPRETFHNDQPVTMPPGVHYTDAITDKAVEYLRAHRATDQPLFLYLAYNAPHYPLEAPAELVAKYRRRFADRGLFAIYAAMVEHLDAGIGRVIATLRELNLAENTLVVFTSDNGPSAEPNAYGPEGAEFSNGPLREYKFSTHEGGLRVPFIARWPGRIPAGTVRDEPGITMDLLPTFLEAAGVKPAAHHEIHGTSLLPLLAGGKLTRSGAALGNHVECRGARRRVEARAPVLARAVALSRRRGSVGNQRPRRRAPAEGRGAAGAPRPVESAALPAADSARVEAFRVCVSRAALAATAGRQPLTLHHAARP